MLIMWSKVTGVSGQVFIHARAVSSLLTDCRSENMFGLQCWGIECVDCTCETAVLLRLRGSPGKFYEPSLKSRLMSLHRVILLTPSSLIGLSIAGLLSQCGSKFEVRSMLR